MILSKISGELGTPTIEHAKCREGIGINDNTVLISLVSTLKKPALWKGNG